MIQIPFNDLIKKIKEKSSLSEEQINNKIKEKMDKLSGLISKEGAAHIIANELGIKIFEEGRLKIKDILIGMRDVEFVGKAQQIFDINEFVRQDGTQGKIASLILGDETGTIRVAAWGDHADKVREIKPDMIIKIKSGYVKDNNGRKEVHLGNRSEIILNPKGETVQAIKEEEEGKRKNIKELQENEQNITILGTIVQVSEPRFFEICPECGKRIKLKDDKFECEEHSVVEPDFSYVFNVFLDDGTDNIRVTCFRNQMEKLTNKNRNEILKYRTTIDGFEKIKNELLGNIVKFAGRVNKNEMFDRLEFIANRVYIDLDPEEEIKKLNEEVERVSKEEAVESD